MKTKKGLLVLILLALTFVLGFALTACGEEEPPAPTTYTVTFSTDGGSPVAGQTVAKDGKVVQPASPTKSGFTFDGWYKDGAFANVWTFDTDTVTGDITLHAKWTENVVAKYTVTFNSNDGSAVESLVNVAEGSKIAKPVSPTKDHYSFVDWYTDSAFSADSVWRFGTDTVEKDTTLHAKWDIDRHTVTFNSQGGTTVTSATTDYDTTIDEPTDPAMTGHTFGGWYKDADCKDVWTFATEKVTVDTELFAKWEAKTYTITFNTSGGTPASFEGTGTYDELLTVPDTAFTKEHYEFKAGDWYTDAACTKPWTLADDKVTDKMTLYAKWTPIKYTVTFVVGEGSTPVDSLEIDYLGRVTKPKDPKKPGFQVEGWYIDEEYKTPWDFENDTVKGTTTIYANWKVATYLISFNTYGGTIISPITVTHGATLVSSSLSPKKHGYAFDGWYEDGKYEKEWGMSTPFTEALTLHAKWSQEVVIFTLNDDEKSYTLTKYNQALAQSDAYEIPALYEGKPVTKIADDAFAGNNILKTITFGKTSNGETELTTIGANAFGGCTFTEMTLPNSVTTIGKNAFSLCALTEITLPYSVTTIGSSVFESCFKLTKLILSDQITTLPARFIYGTRIDELVLPASVTTIETDAFLRSGAFVWLSENVTVIKSNAFGYDSIVSVTFAENAPLPPEWNTGWKSESTVVIYGQSKRPIVKNGIVYETDSDSAIVSKYLRDERIVTIPSTVIDGDTTYTVRKIKGGAFKTVNLSSLAKVDLPNTITEIASGAFDGHSNLSVLWVPKEVGTIAADAITNSLKAEIFTDATVKPDGWLTDTPIHLGIESSPETVYNQLLVQKINDAYTITADYSSLGFSDIVFPTSTPGGNTITAIGANASLNISGKVVIPAGYTTIGANAITTTGEVYIPSSITSMAAAAITAKPHEAYNVYVENTELEVQAKITADDWKAGWLNTVENANVTVVYGASQPKLQDKVVYKSINDTEAIALFTENGVTEIDILGEITIGNNKYNVTSVADLFAFNCMEILTSVTIGEGIITIGEYAFDSCSELKSVSLPTTLTTIEDGVFYECGIKSLTLPSNLTTIGTVAFWSSNEIFTEVIVPESVTTIGIEAFGGGVHIFLDHATYPDGFVASWQSGDCPVYLFMQDEPTAEDMEKLPIADVVVGYWHYENIDGVDTLKVWEVTTTPTPTV